MNIRMMRSARIAAVAALMTGGVAIGQPVSVSAVGFPDNGPASINCTTTISPFPGQGNGSCNGTATGIANGTSVDKGAAAIAAKAFTSSFSYNEPCPPTTGQAVGSYASGTASGWFSWARDGLTVFIALHPDGWGSSYVTLAGLFLPAGVTAASLKPPCYPAANLAVTIVAVGAGV